MPTTTNRRSHQKIDCEHYGNNRRRRGVWGDGDEGVFNIQIALEVDRAGDAEPDGSRAFGLDGGAQAALAGIIEIGDRIDGAATPADGLLSVTFGRGERKLTLRERAD